MGTDNELCAFSRLIFARSATGHPHFYVKPIFVGLKSTPDQTKPKEEAKCDQMSVNVGLDGRGRYHKRWTAFGLGCGAFKLPWGPFFDAHIMPKKGWISSLDCPLSGT